MLLRFVVYGLIGWCCEIVWTASYDLVTGTARAPGDAPGRVPLSTAGRLRLAGRTYLWMLFIYGGGALVFEPAHEAVRHLPLVARGAVYAAGCFAVEYVAGFLLKRATGACPWDYSYARTSVHGYIRLDYTPAWFVFGLFLERVHDVLIAVEPSLRVALGLGKAL